MATTSASRPSPAEAVSRVIREFLSQEVRAHVASLEEGVCLTLGKALGHALDERLEERLSESFLKSIDDRVSALVERKFAELLEAVKKIEVVSVPKSVVKSISYDEYGRPSRIEESA